MRSVIRKIAICLLNDAFNLGMYRCVSRRYARGGREFAIAKNLGFTSAVTTIPGNIFSEHANRLYRSLAEVFYLIR